MKKKLDELSTTKQIAVSFLAGTFILGIVGGTCRLLSTPDGHVSQTGQIIMPIIIFIVAATFLGLMIIDIYTDPNRDDWY